MPNGENITADVATGYPRPDMPYDPPVLTDLADEGCRDCGRTTRHTYECSLARRSGNTPDRVRLGDCCTCPGDPSASAAGWNADCPLHGKDSSWHAPTPASPGPLEEALREAEASPSYRAAAAWVDPTQAPTYVHAVIGDARREREKLLAESLALIDGAREAQYGSAIDGFSRTGQLWAAILDLDVVTAEQVALCLAALKISRLTHDTSHRDSWLDLIGYAALGGDIAADTAKDARTSAQR